MLTFANPSLLPLLALLVPLAIHLWNRRPGREVAVGSVRWLTAGANRRLRNLRLEQAGLLALRLLIVAGAAGLLAGPGWRARRPPGRGQVLVAPALAGSSALAAERPRLDSLRRRGYGLRWLAPGLPLIGPAAWRADSLGALPDTIRRLDHLAAGPDWYAARVQLAADSLPGQPLLVLVPATLRGNAGTRPASPAGVTWRVLPLDAAATWLQAAGSTGGGDSLRLLLGRGTGARTGFGVVRVTRPQAGALLTLPDLPPLRYRAATASAEAALTEASGWPDSAAARLPVRPAVGQAWLVAGPTEAADARPLRAALQAAALGLPGPLALTVSAAPPDTARPPAWLFWLRDEPVPAAWQRQVRRGLHLWVWPAARAGRADTAYLAAPAPAAPVAVWRHAALPATPGAEVLWQDGRGQPLLTRQLLGRGAAYRLATRLAPAWSELADSPELPAWLLDALSPAFNPAALRRLAAHDPRRLDPAQVLAPATRPAASRRPTPALSPPADLRPWLALLTLALFGLERTLAARRARRSVPG